MPLRDGQTIAVVIPALNEAESIGRVLDDIPDWVDDIVVGDNGSKDGTAEVARAHGARVVHEPMRGYGSACLAAMAALDAPDIVVFLDADYSDHPEEMADLLEPILHGGMEMVIGSRVRGEHEPGALTPQAAFGNWLATGLIRLIWGERYTDLGPFRAITYRALLSLGMRDPDYGWTVEMQIKAALHGIAATEVPVSYRKRVGVSKVSGTVRGVVGAAYKILGTIAASALFSHPARERARLVLFTRYPEAGTTKTRMIPELGEEGAAELQRAMTVHTVECALPPDGSVSLEVRYTGGDRQAMRRWLGGQHDYAEQGDGDLGARMLRALHENFERGHDRVILIGADCPALDVRTVTDAADALDDTDMVVGRANDGGYYLIGFHRNALSPKFDDVFRDVPWGGDHVRRETMKNARALDLSDTLLESLDDVDRPADLEVWERGRKGARISVIIPALNEAEDIRAAVESALSAENVEVLVVDGGSTDDTVSIAEAVGARVIQTDPGRARQMNAGVAEATGRLLVFLHADTTLPPGYSAQVRRWLATPDVAVGAFTLRIRATGWGYRLIEDVANFRSRYGALPYGDQALFLSRDTFEVLDGYTDLPMMEDADLVLRARNRGRVVTASPWVMTSARDWERRGLVRTTLLNITAIAAYVVGVPASVIRRWYR